MKNLIRLESVGTALNMKTGMTHPINADDTIDFDKQVQCQKTNGDGFIVTNDAKIGRNLDVNGED